MSIDVSRIPNARVGLCEDIYCDDPDIEDFLTHLTYIGSNRSSAWVCQECLERWEWALEDFLANADDFDLSGAPVIF